MLSQINQNDENDGNLNVSESAQTAGNVSAPRWRENVGGALVGGLWVAHVYTDCMQNIAVIPHANERRRRHTGAMFTRTKPILTVM